MERELAKPMAEVASRFKSGERLASELIIRSQPDAAHLFGVLPQATLVRVRRHKTLKEMPADVRAALRDSMLSDPDVLGELYLRPYSKLYRFLHTRRVPIWFIRFPRLAEISFG